MEIEILTNWNIEFVDDALFGGRCLFDCGNDPQGEDMNARGAGSGKNRESDVMGPRGSVEGRLIRRARKA